MPPATGQPPPFVAETNSGEITLFVDEVVYCKDALLRTCYWLTDRCYLFFFRPRPGVYGVRIRAKTDGLMLDTVAGEFENALIDQQLRLDISRETAKLRELIVAKALAEGDLLDNPPVGDDRDPVERANSLVSDSRVEPGEGRHK